MKLRSSLNTIIRTLVRYGVACSLLLCYSISHADIASLSLCEGPRGASYSFNGVHRVLTTSTFTLTEVRHRMFTPNGDNRNDHVEFVYENPADAALAGKIYNLHGTLVAELTPGAPNTLEWDGSMSNGVPAIAGVYVYQIEATGSETRVINGVVVVAR